MGNDSAYRNEDAFQPRYMNVIKLQSVVDCDIAIAELKFAIDGIRADIDAGFSDSEWRASAEHALKDYEHKARLVVIKRDSLLASKLENAKKRSNLFSAARDLHDFLWSQSGNTKDWPLHMKCDNDETADTLAKLLQTLKDALAMSEK